MKQIEKWLTRCYHKLSVRQLWLFLFLLVALAGFLGYRYSENPRFVLYLLPLIPLGSWFQPLGRSLYTLSCGITFPVGWLLSGMALLLAFGLVVIPMRLFRKPLKRGWHNSAVLFDPDQPYE